MRYGATVSAALPLQSQVSDIAGTRLAGCPGSGIEFVEHATRKRDVDAFRHVFQPAQIDLHQGPDAAFVFAFGAMDVDAFWLGNRLLIDGKEITLFLQSDTVRTSIGGVSRGWNTSNLPPTTMSCTMDQSSIFDGRKA